MAVAVLTAGTAAALYGLTSAGLAGLMEVLLLAMLALLRVLDGLFVPLLGRGALSVVSEALGRLQQDVLRHAAGPLLLAAAGLTAATLSGTWLLRQRPRR